MSIRNVRLPLPMAPPISVQSQVSANSGSQMSVCPEETWVTLHRVSHCRHPSFSDGARDATVAWAAGQGAPMSTVGCHSLSRHTELAGGHGYIQLMLS